MIRPQDVIAPWNKEELLGAIALDRERLSVEKRRATVAMGLFILSALMVLVFSDLGPLHAFWIPLGLIALAIAPITMMYVLCAVLRMQGAFSFLRELEQVLADLDQ